MTARLRAVWQRWVARVGAPEDGVVLALVRIGVGLTIAGHLAFMLTSGAATFTWTDLAHGGLSTREWPFSLVGGASPAAVTAVVLAGIGAALCFAAGAFVPASLVVTYLLLRALVDQQGQARGGYDAVFFNSLVLLLFGACGGALSMDAWRRGVQPARKLIRQLLVVQLGVLYFVSVLYKLGSGWVPGGPGTALWYILQQPMWARTTALPGWLFPLTYVFTRGTWLFEGAGLLFVASVLLRENGSTGRVARLLARVHFREIDVVSGVLMHLGIEASMHVGPFGPAVLSLYPAAFTPAEWRRFFAWVQRRRVRRVR